MKNIITLLFIASFGYMSAKCTIFCKSRYYITKSDPITVGTYSGDEIGETTIYAPTAGSTSYWSVLYSENVTFYSGYEFNQAVRVNYYNNFSIIAVINWNNGGQSVIELYKWKTELVHVDEKEIMYNNATGEKIPGVSGKDRDGRTWEIYF